VDVVARVVNVPSGFYRRARLCCRARKATVSYEKKSGLLRNVSHFFLREEKCTRPSIVFLKFKFYQ
jgi:hypothetical protein